MENTAAVKSRVAAVSVTLWRVDIDSAPRDGDRIMPHSGTLRVAIWHERDVRRFIQAGWARSKPFLEQSPLIELAPGSILAKLHVRIQIARNPSS